MAPEFQGRYAGVALIKWGIELSESSGLPIYCESSPTTFKLYLKFGFKVLKEKLIHSKEVLGTDEDIEVPLMVRMPSAAGELSFEEWQELGYPSWDQIPITNSVAKRVSVAEYAVVEDTAKEHEVVEEGNLLAIPASESQVTQIAVADVPPGTTEVPSTSQITEEVPREAVEEALPTENIPPEEVSQAIIIEEHTASVSTIVPTKTTQLPITEASVEALSALEKATLEDIPNETVLEKETPSENPTAPISVSQSPSPSTATQQTLPSVEDFPEEAVIADAATIFRIQTSNPETPTPSPALPLSLTTKEPIVVEVAALPEEVSGSPHESEKPIAIDSHTNAIVQNAIVA